MFELTKLPCRLATHLAVCLMLAAPASAQQNGNPADSETIIRDSLALVYSSNVVTETTKLGLSQLEALADQGDTRAMVELGGLYLYGSVVPQSWKKARALFDRAAEAGDASGLSQYGMMLMWTERDWRKGQQLLEAAGRAGNGEAWAILAAGAMYGYLGGGRASRQKFSAYAQSAREAGVSRIAVLEAERAMWGISQRASGPKAVRILRDASDDGNAEAAAYLVRLLRDGNGLNIARQSDEAAALLSKYKDLIDPDTARELALTLTAARARTAEDWTAVTDQLLSQAPRMSRDDAGDLFKANPNVATMVLQRKLTAAGYGTLAPSGYMGRPTLKAMLKACDKIAPPEACADSVARPDVIGWLMSSL